MKKTLSIFLIVTMLLSMFAMALPTFAAGETVDNTKTPGHADYDHVTKAEFAAALEIEESAVNVITNYDEYCAITSGAADAIKYYLVDLSADADGVLDLTTAAGTAHVNNKHIQYAYIDFNGYTVDVGGYNNAMFNQLTETTVKNVKIIGTMYTVTASWKAGASYYNYSCGGAGYSPMTTLNASSGAGNGIVHLDNVLSDVDLIIMQQHGGGKYHGGVITNGASGSTFKKVVNTGSIVAVTDDAAVAAGKSGVVKVGHIGGIVGTTGTATFEDCVNEADIVIESADTPCDGTANFGGIVGNVSGDGNFKNCVNRGDLDTENLVNGASNPAIGGVVGKVTGVAKAEGCSNYGDINNRNDADNTFKHMGGIIGRVEGAGAYIGYDITDVSKKGLPCYNEGNFVVNGYFNNDHAQPTGGIIGSAWCGANVYGATNKGNITIYGYSAKNAQSGAAGIVGAWGAIGITAPVIENCVNEGDIIQAGSGKPTTGFGGMVGRIGDGGGKTMTIRNCINKGDMIDGAWNGGLVGLNSDGVLVIENSQNYGAVSAGKAPGCTDAALNTTYVGGFVGFDRKSITVEDSTNNGAVSITYDSPTGKIHYLGGFVGYSTGNAKFDGVVNKGEVIATGASKTAGYIGGLIGWANGKLTVLDSTNDSRITTTVNKYHIGGIAGMANRASDFDNVVNTSKGDIYAYVNDSDMIGIGGMVGYQGAWGREEKFDFYRCSNLGDIVITGNGKNGCLGGIVGRIVGQPGIIKNSANAGNILVNLTAGGDNGQAGIVGLYQRATGNYTMDIINCVNIGEINGMHTGGIVGTTIFNEEARKLTVTIDNCLNAGVLNGTKTKDGIFARNNEPANTPTTITNCNGAATVSEAEVFATSLGLSLTSSMPKALDLAIKGAELLFESGEVYTDASWANFLAALNTAKVYQANTDLTKADPNEVNGYIELLANAKNALVLGGDIYTGADFAKLNGQKGTFNLMADITITAGVDSFAGILNANGHTITVVDCALFGELNGAEINNLVVKGTATDALFGKAVGEIAIDYIYVDVAGDFAAAVLFDDADAEAEIEIKGAFVAADSAAKAAILAGDCDIELKTVVADVTAPALTTASEPEYDSAYLVGVEAYIDEEAIDLDDGAVAYAFTKAFVDANALASVKVDYSDVTLVQILGIDAYPEVAPFAVDGINVVAPIMEGSNIVGYKNAAIRYEDATPVLPVEPIAPIAPVVSGLQSSIAKAEALVEANYTADTWAAVKTALAAAKAALTADTQAAIDDARFALDLAVAGLKKVPAPAAPSVSLDAINAAIAAAEAKNAGEYTTATWSAVQAALSAAKSAKALGDQAAIDAATTALNAAVAALAKAPAPEAPVISKPAVTEPAAEEGCGGVIGGAAVVLTAVVALGAGVSFKKKED